MLLAAGSSNAAAEWVEVGGNENATTYADPATIRRAGNSVTMWHLIDYVNARAIEGAKPYMSITMQDEYDCNEERARTLSISVHTGNMGEGEVIGITTKPWYWRPVSSDTLVETLRAFACEKQ